MQGKWHTQVKKSVISRMEEKMMTTQSACSTPGGARIMQGAMRWLASLVLALAAGLAMADKPYTYYPTGNPQAEVNLPLPATASHVLMGGGPDVDEAFRWMIERAGIKPGTGGRFVIIRASGADGYNDYIYYSDAKLSTSKKIQDDWIGGASLGLSSVETLVIPSIGAANSDFVNAVVARAHAVFIAGGDQSDYIKFWKGTRLDATLKQLLDKNIPIGGTSAGLAVLGQFDFAALNGTVTSSQALSNPFNKYMTLDPSPLSSTGFIVPPALSNTILDSHLDTRDRMGRLMAFVARLVAPSNGPGSSFGCPGGILAAANARGIGIGVETALLVQGKPGNAGATARRVTNPDTTTESAVYFLQPLNPPSTCADGKPLNMTTVEIRKLANSNSVFDLSNWSGLPVYKIVDILSGQLADSPY